MGTPRLRVAIVGGGWAGLAAAVHATDAGHSVTILESTRQLGGRARRVTVTTASGETLALDNGQHILIGAYRDTLGLMRRVGLSPAERLLRLPLTLRFPDGGGLALPDWPAPLDAAWGILTARGWSLAERVSLLRAAARWQRQGFHCGPATSVQALCRAVAPRVMAEMIEPLCVAALNTPADRASGQVFLRVMQDALLGPREGGWAASNLLLPTADLNQLFPDAACTWLQARGAAVRAGVRVGPLERRGADWVVAGSTFDRVILALPAWEAARVAADTGLAAPWSRAAAALAHEPIATVYVTGGPRLALPMLALRSTPQAPAQFVFDRSQLGGSAGLLAFVASASRGDAQAVEHAVLAQARRLGWAVQPLRTIIEKRATFACTPGLQRPAMDVAPGVLACGDYVDGPYPATLEGAVRSARAAVSALTTATRTAPASS